MAQGFPIALNFGTSIPMPIGQTVTVTATVKDIVNNTVQLIFVALRFEWNAPNSFFVGSNSEKGAVLVAGQQITYDISVQIPNNVTPGTHRLSGYATYRVLQNGNWTRPQAGWWVSDIEFAYPQTLLNPNPTNPNPTASNTTPQLPVNPGTIILVTIVIAIGLFLERGRIKRLLRRPGATKAEPAVPESQEPKPEVIREEEDL